MNRTVAHSLLLILVCICLGCSSTSAQGLRSIGLRVALSWTETPIWAGIEASTDTSWGNLSAGFFITPTGKTLFTGHIDVPLQEGGAAFVRLTGGFYYFEASQPFPYPLIGAGLSYLLVSASPIYVGFASEFIYPLAFPLPMFSLSSGWLR
ncbi:hypothetical protein IH601_12020 [Candidatus Bipolaricaulota bacterium]|jgi:hypothetical protein|nr:hypothetical protein [Candidatus Bipolaricaulota bacterium]TFH10836.1 MAG: hypothetical protein E4H08_02725 [Candidatus Atribacteria bacterium]